RRPGRNSIARPSASKPPAPAWSSLPATMTSPAGSAWRGIIIRRDTSSRAKQSNSHSGTVRRTGPGISRFRARCFASPRNDKRRKRKMSDRLKGKRALVTAAAAGIGRASAIAFAQEGAIVFATDIDEKGLAALASEGVKDAARLDVRDSSAVGALAKRVGNIDILLNAAGFVHHGTVLDCSDDDWDFSFDLNVKSMHRTIRAFLPGMLEKGGGSIVNISSAAGVFKAAPNRYVYGATKAAVAALTRAVAVDFITKGIRCNCICPGTIETPSMLQRAAAAGPGGREMFVSRQPMGRLGTAEEIALLAVYLGSDESAFTTGVAHIIDGGWTLSFSTYGPALSA